MPILFRCPACGRDLEAPDGAYGLTGSCRFCGAQIASPPASGEPATLLSAGATGSQPPPAGNYNPVAVPTGYLDVGEILAEAWDLLKIHWATLMAAELATTLLAVVVMLPVIIPLLIYMFRTLPTGEPPMMSSTVEAWFSAGMMILGFLLQPIIAGPLYVTDRIIARGDSSLGAIFAGFRQYRALVVFAALIGSPMLVLTALQAVSATRFPILSSLFSITGYIVQVFLLATLQPGLMEIIDKGSDPVSALYASWEFTKGHRLMVLATTLVMGLAYMAGLFAFCVGAFFTIGFIPLGTVLIYRHLRGLNGTPEV